MFAYPDAPADLMAHGALDHGKCCIACSRCTELMRLGSTPGCVVRDHPLYSTLHREAAKAAGGPSMIEDRATVAGVSMPVYSVNTLVIGSGAAALNAAVWLRDFGQHDLAIVTEGWGGGTSANAGSDKQTYYKLALAGRVPDSPRLLAEDLFAGGSMHGDIALCEAQHSAQAFYRLVQLGVPFPHDRFGAYPGYQTDHDQRGRATSAGPLTSHLMVEALTKEVALGASPCFEPCQVVALLTATDGGRTRVVGALALDLDACAGGDARYCLFNAANVVLGTGGPGGMYLDSVYPVEQTGSIGLAFRAGATAQNLTESQFGLASIGVRWNVSGSYQQVVPRYVSTDGGGGDAREFLNDAFPDAGTLTAAVFRKGYQWPFDPRRVRDHGSSLIDLLVYRERVERGRRVFLDFTRNFDGGARLGPFSLGALHDEARQYLEKCGATGATPIERLAPDEPAGHRLLPRARHRPQARPPGDRRVRAAQQRRPARRPLVGVERRGALPRRRSERLARRAAAGRRVAERRAGRRPARGDVHRAPATRPAPPTPPRSRRQAAPGRDAAGTRAGDAARRQPASGAAPTTCAARSSAGCRGRPATSAGLELARGRRSRPGAVPGLRRAGPGRRPGDLPAVFRNRDLCVAHVVYLEASPSTSHAAARAAGRSSCRRRRRASGRLNPPGSFVDTPRARGVGRPAI